MEEESLRRLEGLVKNPSTLIPHVHCFGDYDAEFLEKVDSLLKSLENSGDWKVVRINCAYVDGNLKAFLSCLAEEFGIKDRQLAIEKLGLDIGDYLGHSQRLLLALYDSHALSEFSGTVANAILNIPNLMVGGRILTISELAWETTCATQAIGGKPVQIFVKNTLDDETMISRLSESLKTEDIKGNLIRLAVSATSCHTRDLELIEKIIRAASKHTEKEVTNFISTELRSLEDKLCLTPDVEDQNKALESLPIELKLLLIASFFATHNSVITDKRFFSKNHGRDKRSEVRERNTNASIAQNESGPKSADLQRILFIRNALVALYRQDIEADVKVNILTENNSLPLMTTLTHMAIIDMSSAKSNLDQPKFRCMIAHDLAQKIATSIHITLREHLEFSNY